MAQKIDLEEIQQRLMSEKQTSSESGGELTSGRSETDYTIRERAGRLAERLWPMMNEAYGYKWSSQFGDEPTDVWIGALCGVTGEQIGSALHRCKELYPVWPPGAIEFAALCEGRDPRNVDSEGNDAHWQQRWIARCDAERLAEARSRDSWLEDQGAKERAREAGAKALAEMKATLGLK